jgi:regulation of enolase protein 1 (concanavalin A-like superfamily)
VPCWLRLTRAGNVFTGYFSIDGTNWTALGSQTLALPSTVYVGFAVSSHSATDLNAAFSGIQVQ